MSEEESELKNYETFDFRDIRRSLQNPYSMRYLHLLEPYSTSTSVELFEVSQSIFY